VADCPCKDNELRCTGTAVEVCKAAVWSKQKDCTLGCAAAACVQVTGVALGGVSSHALLSDGTVRSWGGNASGVLGLGASGGQNAKPTRVDSLADVVELVAHGTRDASAQRAGHACVRLADGSARCWGHNEAGQCGTTPGTQGVATPSLVALPDKTAEIAVGGQHSCARLVNGEVWCWGDGSHGQLGQGAATSSAAAVKVDGIGPVKRLALEKSRSCALLTSGSVVCWGFRGGPVEAAGDDALKPETLEGPVEATELRAGSYFGCAQVPAGLACWGSNEAKQLGGVAATFEASAKPLVGLNDVVSFALGERHGCAAQSSGIAKCWGSNDSGQLGKSPGDSVAVPDTVPKITNAIQIAAGVSHSCAVEGPETITCWGQNDLGQLGTGASSPQEGASAVVW
jgi:alpha-tubulin suppressor-like RCC1 family protein